MMEMKIWGMNNYKIANPNLGIFHLSGKWRLKNKTNLIMSNRKSSVKKRRKVYFAVKQLFLLYQQF